MISGSSPDWNTGETSRGVSLPERNSATAGLSRGCRPVRAGERALEIQVWWLPPVNGPKSRGKLLLPCCQSFATLWHLCKIERNTQPGSCPCGQRTNETSTVSESPRFLIRRAWNNGVDFSSSFYFPQNASKRQSKCRFRGCISNTRMPFMSLSC